MKWRHRIAWMVAGYVFGTILVNVGLLVYALIRRGF